VKTSTPELISNNIITADLGHHDQVAQ
jgi:hypothetical protein